MDRRALLKRASLVAATGLVSQFIAPGAYAADCALTEHLKGFIPPKANATISSTGQFHHFHYLHVPEAILLSPPAEGWTTLSSMMRPELGMDDFFFREAEERKQFHCHQVFFSSGQLINIAAGTQTEVVAFIRSNTGPRKNHSFIFNRAGLDPALALEQEKRRIKQLAADHGLNTESVKCDTRSHVGVTVFNSRGDRVVTSASELERLRGY